MAMVPTPVANEWSSFPEVEMGGDSSSPTVRATVVQASTIFYDTPATLDKAERLLAEAASHGAQLVVFPEAFIGGYPRGSTFGVTIGNRTDKGKEEYLKYHASAIDVPGPEVDRLAAMAGKYKVYLVMGVIERDGYTLYCTVLFFDPQGHYLGKHRKIMPTALERIIWGCGDGSTIPVYDTPIGKIGAAICWENRMPLLRTAMYAKGIEIYCAPTADSREVWQASMTHIALEGGCFVLSANQFCRRKDYPPPPEYVFSGTEEDLTPDSVVCAGGSVIISPSGAVLAGPNYDGEALISADLGKAERLLAQAASNGAQLVVFPEAFIGGYPLGSTFGVSIGNRSPKGNGDFRKYHASAINVPGPEIERLAAMAGKSKVYLVMGVIERDGDTLYSTVLFFDPLGHYLGKHRKIMLTELEQIIWGYGDGSTLPVFDTPIGKIGAAISRENRMPLLRTAMYAKGIEIFCAPTAARVCLIPPVDIWRDAWEEYMTHTAMEGGCFVLSANQFCRRRDYPPPPEYFFSGIEDFEPDSVVCTGGSVIISPSGVVLAGPYYDREAVLSANLDKREIAAAKLDFDVVGKDARPDVLSLFVRDHPLRSVSLASTSTRP